MNTYSITIEVPEGWEPKQLSLRSIEKGENFLNVSTGHVGTWEYDHPSKLKNIPLQRKWVPPASCPKGVTFRLNVFNEWIFSVIDEPDAHCYYASRFYSDFTPPPSSPYTVA